MRRMVGLTSTILMTVSTAPWPLAAHRTSVVRVKASAPDLAQTSNTRLGTVVNGRRFRFTQNRTQQEPQPISTTYHISTRKTVRVDQTGLRNRVLYARVQPAEHKPHRTPHHASHRDHTTIHTSPVSYRRSTSNLSSRGSSLESASMPAEASNMGRTIANYALHFVGSPYRWGGESPAGFDCSGLSQYIYALVHVAIPRTSYEQYAYGKPVSRSALLPGDLVFFRTDAAGASHVAIYVGNGLIVQALNQRTGVVVSHLSDAYYEDRYVGAKRAW